MILSTRSHVSWRCLVLACSLVIYPAVAWAWQVDAPAVQRLVTAARQGEVESVKQLLDEGADANATLPSGLTALHAARISGHDDVAQLLLKRGADEKIPLPPLEKLVDSLIADRLPDGSPGVAVLVARDHEVLLKRGYGYASLEHSVPVSPSTRFRIGSVTKQFTAVAILQLVELGKLKLDDPLSRFLPGFPQGDKVTIQQLLTHTSGIRSYTDKPDFMSGVTKEVSPTELIESFKNEPYDFSPGEGWHYNNSGYFLLGFIIAQVSGDSYAEYLRKHIFEPLEMNDTGIHDATSIIKHEAHGYAYDADKFSKAVNWNMAWAGGAGAIYSTVEDLHRWNQGLFSGKLINDASLQQAITPVTLPEGVHGLNYGLGLVISDQRGLKVIEHGGGLHGFMSHLAYYPQHQLTVAVLHNSSPPVPGLTPGALSRVIAQVVLWQEMKPRESPSDDSPKTPVNPKLLDDYVGQYDYQSAIMTISKEQDRLFAQMTGQPKYEIFAKSDNEFFWKVVEAQITFMRNEQGQVTHAVHRQEGQTFSAPKLANRRVAKVDPEILQKYVGKYDYGMRVAILEVTVSGERVFAQLTGQPKLEILPSSPTTFFWKDVNAEVTFVVGEEDRIEKAIHRQGGRTINAPRIE